MMQSWVHLSLSKSIWVLPLEFRFSHEAELCLVDFLTALLDFTEVLFIQRVRVFDFFPQDGLFFLDGGSLQPLEADEQLDVSWFGVRKLPFEFIENFVLVLFEGCLALTVGNQLL